MVFSPLPFFLWAFKMCYIVLMKSLLSIFISLIFILFSVAVQAQEGRRISFLRDAEIEDTLNHYSKPLFIAAGLNPAAVRLYLIHDDSLNAFVAGGQNVFFHSGLLFRAETPEQVMGVLAHELGHVAGGHLARTQEEMSSLSAATIAAMVLGGAAAAVAGSGQGVAAVVSGSSQIGQRLMLRYSRTQESAADQAGVRFMANAQLPPEGLLEFMKILGRSSMYRSNIDPYLQSHPLTDQRVEFLENQEIKSPLRGRRVSADLQARQERMRGKLLGFLSNPQQVLNPVVSTGQEKYTPATLAYARAIALYRLGDSRGGEEAFAALFKASPKDAFLHDTRGQLRLENGNVAAALEDYRAAFALAPDSAMIRMAYAKTILADEVQRSNNAAQVLTLLRPVTVSEPDTGESWRLMAQAYDVLGKLGLSALCDAERALRQGDRRGLAAALRRAEPLLKDEPSVKVRLEDLKNALVEIERQ